VPKLPSNISEVLLNSANTQNTACSQHPNKGYSLYRRQVSLIPVEIPFPKGTSTPPSVVVAVGSGAVLPKPRKGKNISYKSRRQTQTLHMKRMMQPAKYYLTYILNADQVQKCLKKNTKDTACLFNSASPYLWYSYSATLKVRILDFWLLIV